jgi:hypothetical protein
VRDVEEIPFSDGHMSGAVRVGDTVHRRMAPASPAVHALLRELSRVGFEGCPHVLGFDERGREILTFVDGETIAPSLDGRRDERLLRDVARLLRSYHDATRRISLPDDLPWQWQPGAPRQGDVICHNDVAPWNTVVRAGVPIAFIDWDVAAPGPAIWDVAYAVWRFVPLHPAEHFGPIAVRARRMGAFCHAYGMVDRAGLLDVVLQRQQALLDAMRAGAAAGDIAFGRLWEAGHGEGIARDMEFVRRNRAKLA